MLRLGADRFWVLQALRGVVACVWILPPSLLMGMTFPAVVAALEAWQVVGAQRWMARFYALNLVGAVLGATWWFPTLGLHGTLALTVAIECVVAAVAFGLSRGANGLRTAPHTPQPKGPVTRELLALAFGSGFITFTLEVVCSPTCPAC